jgi:hypothetical protein
MTHFTKSSDGKYVVLGKKFDMLIGSRAQVWHHTAYKTTGGLTRMHLLQNKNGRIVSKKKHATAKKEKRLVKAGFVTKKGVFGSVKRGKSRKMSRNKRGGSGVGYALSPSPYDGKGVGTSGVALQFIAGQGN